MNKKMRLFALLIFSFLVLHGCASKPPSQQENICSIFEQKSSWYRLANKSLEKWGAPIHVQMSILRQESAFQNRVKPCLLYTSPSPRDTIRSRMPSSA